MKGKHVWIVTKENRKTKELVAICGVYESYVNATKSLKLGDSDIEYTITQVEVK